jgi:hypothetical protein
LTTIKVKPKTIKIGHGYYDLKMLRELVDSLPDGEVELLSYPGENIRAPEYRRDYAYAPMRFKPPVLECHYHRGQFKILTPNLPFYAADNGKAKQVRSLTFDQNPDNIPAKTFSLLSVELKGGKVLNGSN